MPMRQHLHCKAALLALAIASLAGCASTPAEPVPFKAVPQARIVQPGYTQPGRIWSPWMCGANVPAT